MRSLDMQSVESSNDAYEVEEEYVDNQEAETPEL